MDKKKLLAIFLFLLMGFFMFTFANPSSEIERGEETPANETTTDTKDNTSTVNTDTKTNTTKVVRDSVSPVITMNGSDIVIRMNSTYTDLGATATDNIDGDITANIVTVSSVDVTSKGTYTVTYNVSDKAGNKATEVVRNVSITDATELVKAIDESNKITDNTKDRDVSDELKDLLDDLNDATKKGNEVNDNNGSTQDEIDKITDEINEIIDKIKNLEFTVTFINYDEKVLDTVVVKYSEDATTTDPVRLGYTFTGWDKDTTNLANNHTKYTVVTKVENLDGTYTETSEDLYGTTDTLVLINVEGKTGFTAVSDVVVGTILGDESTVLTIVYNRNSYTVTYMVDGVQYGVVDTYMYEAPITLRAKATKEGYIFSGWKNTVKTMGTQNLVFNGSFTMNMNIGVYELKDGIDLPNPIDASSSTKNYTKLTNITLTGDKTVLANTISSITDDQATLAINNDVMNYITAASKTKLANLNKVNYTYNWYVLKYVKGSGWHLDGQRVYTIFNITYTGIEGATNDNATTYTTINNVTFNDAVMTGYTFKGWYINGTKVTSTEGLTGDIKVEAKFIANNDTKYTVTVSEEELDGSYKVVDTKDYTGTSDSKITVSAPTANKGFTLSGDTTKDITINADGTTVVNFNYTRNSYKVTYMVDGIQSGNADSYKYGAAVTMRAIPTKTGYTVSGWNKTLTVMDNEDITISGKFEANKDTKYTVTVSEEKLDGSYEVVDTKDYTGTSDSKVTVSAPTANKGFTLSGDTTKDITINADGTTVVNFNYTRNMYTLTFTINGSVYNTSSVKYGTKITAPSYNAETGYDFSGWNIKENATIDADTIYDATLTKKKFTVNFMVNHEVYASQNVEYGSKATAPVKPTLDGYNFVSWVGLDNVITENTEICSVWEVKKDIKYTVVTKIENVGGTFNTSSVVKNDGVAFENATVTKDAKEGFDISNDSVLTGAVKTDGSLVLTIIYVRHSYTVTFNINNQYYTSSEVKYGTEITIPSYTVKAHFIFTVWTVDKTMPASNMTYNATLIAEQTGIKVVAKPNVQFQFTKGSTVDFTKLITVYAVYANGTEKEVTDYTTDVNTSSVTTTNRTLTITENGFTNKDITYSVISEEAFQTKFEVNFNDTGSYSETSYSGCTEDCDNNKNTDSVKMDVNFLEIVEHYDESIKVGTVNVTYTNGTSEEINVSDSVRWTSKKFYFGGSSEHNPVYIGTTKRTRAKTVCSIEGPISGYCYEYKDIQVTDNIMDDNYVINTVDITYSREGFGTYKITFKYNANTKKFTAIDEIKD